MICDEAPVSSQAFPSVEDQACFADLLLPGSPAALWPESDYPPPRAIGGGLTPEDRLEFDAYGSLSGDDPALIAGRFCFDGQERYADPAVQYNRCRCYDPTPARWLHDALAPQEAAAAPAPARTSADGTASPGASHAP